MCIRDSLRSLDREEERRRELDAFAEQYEADLRSEIHAQAEVDIDVEPYQYPEEALSPERPFEH
eukprot:6672970-Alexandrium_andersonii.AAC.1